MKKQEMGRQKVALLVNIIAPYRVPVYQAIGSHFDLRIFYGGAEGNRKSWQNLETRLIGITVKRSWGLTLHWSQSENGGIYDYRYTHITPGYILDLLKYRPDALITNEMGFRTLVCLVYGKIFRKPVWVWWGGTLTTESSRGSIRKSVRRLISRWTRRWISYGETSTEYLLSLGIERQRILQIQNCVDERLYMKPTDPAMHLDPAPVFLYVGQMIRRKGVDKLLTSAAKLQREGHHFSLLLIGGGPEKQALERLAKELNLENVHFCDPRPPEAMPGIYRSADCLVFPTLADPWGLVVNESLWSNVSVLSSIYAGCAQELLPRENLFDPLDGDDFVAALSRALTGQIASPDLSRLKTCTQVADMIVNDIKGVLSAIVNPFQR